MTRNASARHRGLHRDIQINLHQKEGNQFPRNDSRRNEINRAGRLQWAFALRPFCAAEKMCHKVEESATDQSWGSEIRGGGIRRALNLG